MNLEQHSKDTSVNGITESKPLSQIPPGALAILPLRNTVLFPSTVMPLVVGRPSSLQAVEEAVRQQLPIAVVAQRDPKLEAPQSKRSLRDWHNRRCSTNVYLQWAPAADCHPRASTI